MQHTIGNTFLNAKISTHGAEIQSLFSVTEDMELLWQADEKYWPRHAPILFPIVGRLNSDNYVHEGTTYPLTQHGFARDSDFQIVFQNDQVITLQLASNTQTLAIYPFNFLLEVSYQITDHTLSTTFSVTNTDDKPMPFSIGGHPAFNWPLFKHIEKKAHRIRFEKEEGPTISLLENGLIKTDDRPSPVVNRCLDIEEDIFSKDALIFKHSKSKRIYYEAFQNNKLHSCIELEFKDFNDLGIWKKPNADFICLEPWNGYSDGVFDSKDLNQKPGIMTLSPNQRKEMTFNLGFYRHQ